MDDIAVQSARDEQFMLYKWLVFRYSLFLRDNISIKDNQATQQKWIDYQAS